MFPAVVNKVLWITTSNCNIFVFLNIANLQKLFHYAKAIFFIYNTYNQH